MYRNLNPQALGISGRQWELIETALTHRFLGLDIDIGEIVQKAKTHGMDVATQFFTSARVKIGGFELPVRWTGSIVDFKTDLAGLKPVLDAATALGASRCYTTIRPTSEDLPFPDNFKFQTERLTELAAALAERGIKLGLCLEAAEAQRNNGGYQFIYQADPLLLLLQSIGADNVGLWLDVWNWHVGGGNVEKLRALRVSQIIGVRLSDLPAEVVDPTTALAEQRLLPGEGGQIDSVAYLSLLQELGYEGPISVAAHPSQYKGIKREALVKKAASVMDSLWTAAGIITIPPAGAALAGA